MKFISLSGGVEPLKPYFYHTAPLLFFILAFSRVVSCLFSLARFSQVWHRDLRATGIVIDSTASTLSAPAAATAAAVADVSSGVSAEGSARLRSFERACTDDDEW